jgi:hypothetical protein
MVLRPPWAGNGACMRAQGLPTECTGLTGRPDSWRATTPSCRGLAAWMTGWVGDPSPPDPFQIQPDLFQADSGRVPTRPAAQNQLVGVIVVQQVLIIA